MYQDGLSRLLSFAQSFVVQNLFPTDPGNCRCGGLGNSCPCLLGLEPTLWSLCPGAVCSDLTMFGHGGLSQMGTKGRFPRDGLGAQASCCSSGSLFWGGGWGPGQKSLPAEDSGHQKLVWTQKSMCHLIETNIREQQELEGKKVPQYPCLWVNVSAVGRWAVLYHTEDTRDQNQQCSYIPGSLENYQEARADVEKVRATFHKKQIFYCFSTSRENETSVLYQRLYGPRTLLFSLVWPTFLLTGGLLIIAMVKINQCLSILAAQK
ncbi:calcium-activated potassium channel subunit beta-1 isoform X1 [Zalophus californianus]|uniref:Calcium-activated potassium channel subunit beta n=1 Tax=Zalophus californianus TaxID=9704 RepID=A0A6J2E1X0_ZALCA|nr:calcium-activated potassium channel subunit beta-1 isoform X1 [Zalophus californianus]